MKRWRSFLFSAALACLCFVVLSPEILAAEIVDSGYCGGEGDGTNLTWTLDSEGTLTISGEGAMAQDAFYNNDSIKKLVIGVDTTSIGAYAFGECYSLAEVILPDSVTNIGSHAFYWCTELTSISLPDDITEIPEYTFYHCESLSLVNLPNELRRIGENAFCGCSMLTFVDIPDTVTALGDYVFAGCRLTSVVLPSNLSKLGSCVFSGSPLTSISIEDSNAYYTVRNNCLYTKDLTEILLFPVGVPDFDIWYLPTITTIGDGAFYGCESMENFFIPQGITHIGNAAFAVCKGISSFEVPAGVVSIGNDAFASSDLHTISLPDSLVSIGANAFDSCWRMKGLTIPANVQYIGQAVFLFNSGIKSVIFEGNAPSFHESVFAGAGRDGFFAYYPANNATWTSDKLQDYGGDIVWKPYNEDMLYHTQFSLEDLPQNEFDLKITVTRLGNAADDLAMIALYSLDGKYLETVLWKLSDDTAQTYTLSRKCSDDEIGQIKVFVVDDLSNPAPLSEIADIQ